MDGETTMLLIVGVVLAVAVISVISYKDIYEDSLTGFAVKECGSCPQSPVVCAVIGNKAVDISRCAAECNGFRIIHPHSCLEIPGNK